MFKSNSMHIHKVLLIVILLKIAFLFFRVLTIVAPYDVTIDGTTQYFTGDTLELKCSYGGGSPELLYSWTRNTTSSRNILPTDTSSDASIITINNVTVDDEGVYTCTVSNEGGESSYDIFIMIIGKN